MQFFVAENKNVLYLRIIGVLLFSLSIILVFQAPKKVNRPLSNGLHSTVVALELIENTKELNDLMGSPETKKGKDIRRDFSLNTYIDFIFILAYSFFYLILAKLLHSKKTITKTLYFALNFFIIVALVADYSENFIILRILKESEIDRVASLISPLNLVTYLKWNCLAIISGIAGLGFVAADLRFSASIFFQIFIFGIVGFFYRPFIEIQSIFLAISWMMCWYKSLPLKNAWWD